ncbi:MAG: anti-sigma-I factor RsgI family protein [Ruminococcus sp.]|jgi:hypothetical protein
MNDKIIKDTFDKIHAEEKLKADTKAFLFRKTKGYSRTPLPGVIRLVPAALCLLFLLLCGNFLFLTPTASISIDINPSVELDINRFDQVVSVNGYNQDGRELADSLSLKFMDYHDAVLRLMENDQITALLSRNEILTIAVAGSDGSQCERILSDLESCTDGHENTHCYSASSEEMEAAHELGLSCGRYQAFLELQSLDPDITPEEVQNMTMREIYDLINELSGNEQNAAQSAAPSVGHHGNGNRHGHAHGHE